MTFLKGIMTFNSLKELKKSGFMGFKSIKELNEDSSVLPKTKGVYLVLYVGENTPDFLPIGTGGHFKNRDPNVSVSKLNLDWVNETLVVYVGMAGGNISKATLHSRIKQYLRFGRGEKVGHWGGRYIWQIKDAENLIICRKPLPSDDPRDIEIKLLQEFYSTYSIRPFANLTN